MIARLGFGLALIAVLHPGGGCKKMRSQERMLAVGGVHALDGAAPCTLVRSEPEGALEDLKRQDSLVVRARAEGTAELRCGADKVTLRMVTPASLDVVLVEVAVKAGAHFGARAVPRDGGGRELEIGKWTEVTWSSDGDVAVDNDPSAGEFGLCDTCFGMQGFKAGAAGTVKVKAAFGGASGELTITVR